MLTQPALVVVPISSPIPHFEEPYSAIDTIRRKSWRRDTMVRTLGCQINLEVSVTLQSRALDRSYSCQLGH